MDVQYSACITASGIKHAIHNKHVVVQVYCITYLKHPGSCMQDLGAEWSVLDECNCVWHDQLRCNLLF